jgi:uncharacterized protein YdhG (YjbR/CyaY superfamily)
MHCQSKGEMMQSQETGFRTIDDYIAAFPADVQTLLQAVRATIHAAAPDAVERISYGMPAFAQEGALVYFAALKHHIGFYPTSSGIAAFQQEIAAYESSKGAVKFPKDQPMPLDLIARIVRFRVTENLNRAAAKSQRKAQRRKA